MDHDDHGEIQASKDSRVSVGKDRTLVTFRSGFEEPRIAEHRRRQGQRKLRPLSAVLEPLGYQKIGDAYLACPIPPEQMAPGIILAAAKRAQEDARIESGVVGEIITGDGGVKLALKLVWFVFRFRARRLFKKTCDRVMELVRR